MSILIKGMEMPSKKAIAVVIHPDGTAYSAKMFAGVCTEYLADCTAVPVPPHGDLIDRKAALAELRDGMAMTGYQSRALDCINEFYVPTIIEAEGEK